MVTIQVVFPTLTPALSLKVEGDSDSLPLSGGGLGWGLVYFCKDTTSVSIQV